LVLGVFIQPHGFSFSLTHKNNKQFRGYLPTAMGY